MSDGKGQTGGERESGPTGRYDLFGNAFNSGSDRAKEAEKSAEELGKAIPGAGHGAWDEDEESVSGDVSAYVQSLEKGRDPWHPRQTAHGALDVMQGFLGPHFSSFQATAERQRQVSEDPKPTSGTASSTMKSSTEEEEFRKAAKIRDEDQPHISDDMRRNLDRTRYQTEGALLVAGGMAGHAVGVALDPAQEKAYVVTDSGKLYSVSLTHHVKREFVTTESLGSPGGVALDGEGKAYVTDHSGNRLVRVDLSNGTTETVVTGVQAYAVKLDTEGKTAYVTGLDGKLFAVDLGKKDTKKLIVDGLGPSTSGATLDGNGKAYTGNWNHVGNLWEVDLLADRPTKRAVTALSRQSGDIALDGAGTAYISDHWGDVLYKVDLASGAQRVAVKATGSFSALGVALDLDNGVLYVSTWEGQLWRFALRVLQSPELIEITTGV
ncbi:YncE family protein [Streptomyces sp. SDr-06]|uniref:YncE family protein n=1 Tax=Streptomyces sp. SDr-06 TaxID=2267702 RepID=UPI0011C0361E|nr:YncE family protein [Streptomyces sp. SDr-06]